MDSYYDEIRPRKRKSRFGWGLLVGVVCGVIVALVAVGVAIRVYTKTTGRYLVLGGKSVNPVETSTVLDKKTADKINELNAYIDLYYNGEYEVSDIQNSILAGVMEGLNDPYSVYYTPEEYEDLMESTTGTYYGIGAGLQQDPDTKVVTITKIYKGTPSEEAGMREGDIVIKADGIEATSVELTELVSHIRGEAGTTVHIELYRESSNETLEIDVERRNVELPSVEGKVLDNGIGYVQISEFQTNTDIQYNQCVHRLKEENIKGLIIDLRSNPGGVLSTVVHMLDDILPEGRIVYTEDKYGTQNVYDSDANCESLPMVVLINENSASASEIFAGAIKDYGYGTLVGTNTFGKGIVQNIVSLEDGDALKITTAKYFTPNGNYIHGVGIAPDIEVKYEYSGPLDEPYDMQYDNQLQKAIEVMLEKF